MFIMLKFVQSQIREYIYLSSCPAGGGKQSRISILPLGPVTNLCQLNNHITRTQSQ